MARQPHNRPPFQQQTRQVKLPKPPAAPAQAPDAKPARRAPKVALEPLQITEKVFIRTRPEKVYFAAINPLDRPRWDANVQRVRYVTAKKGDPTPSRAAEGVILETIYPLRLGGLFHMQYAMIRQPQGFALQAVKGSFGVLGGLAESWVFEPFKGGTQVTFVRSLVPRFRPLRNYVERNQVKAMKATLEGLKKFVEDAQK